MVEVVRNTMASMAPLSGEKNSQLAAFLGFAAGGIGLGIYFRSFIDTVIPIGILIALSVTFNLAQLDELSALLAGGIIAALYGYFRAETSNGKLAESHRTAI